MSNNHTQFTFSFKTKKLITANFNGGMITSDGGLLLLHKYEEKIKFSEQISNHLVDKRTAHLIRYDLEQIVRQLIYQNVAGYEDAIDANYLRNDPTFRLISNQAIKNPLASQPTISRFENMVTAREVVKLNRFLLDFFIQRYKQKSPKRIILDGDPTDDPCHGAQQLSLFNAFYDQHMYYPLLIFEGGTASLLSVRLRSGTAAGPSRLLRHLRWMVGRLRQEFPKVAIIYRSDAAAAVPAVYCVLREIGVDYLIGIGTNEAFERKAAPLVKRLAKEYQRTGRPLRHYTHFWHQAGSWPWRQRILLKVEYGALGANVRFVVTSFRLGKVKDLFELYDRRGACENWIKELKNNLKADRLSCERFVANAYRLVCDGLAYALVHAFRTDVLKGTDLAQATVETLRWKLFKVGALVKETVRRIWFYFSSGWPFRSLFIQGYKNLCFDTS